MARGLLMLGATMIAMSGIPRGEVVATADQRCVMRATWTDYEALDAMRGDHARPRITYLDGAVELMSPSNDHERIKSWIGHLVESFCIARRIVISPYGSWTLKSKLRDAAAEADECYVFGPDRKPLPDLAIEVVWTSGGFDKLEVYRRLGVGEVWFWKDDRFTIHVLRANGYASRDRSVCLPDLDLEVLASLLDLPTLNDASERMQALAKSLG
jgi:Uma2 family endonuclease